MESTLSVKKLVLKDYDVGETLGTGRYNNLTLRFFWKSQNRKGQKKRDLHCS